MQIANHEIIKTNPELNMRFNIVEVNTVYTALHWHDSLEILYILDGELESIMENETDVLKANDFVVIDRKVIHATSSKQHCRYLLWQIPTSFLKQFIPNFDSTRFPYICSLKEKDGREILNQMRTTLSNLANLCEHQTDGYQMKYFSLLFSFLDLLLTHYKKEVSSKEIKQTEKYIERLSLITDYVSDHYQEAISLQEVAKVLSVNPEYFARFFKKYMGITFLEYVYSIRLQAAYQDVINTDLNIQEIQDKNGFASPKIFSRMFKEQYGTTPGQLRKQNAQQQ